MLMPPLFRRGALLTGALLVSALVWVPSTQAQDKKNPVREELLQKDFPFQVACIGAQFPKDNIAMKGVAIRLANDAAVVFDTDLLRLGAGWTGGFINTRGVVFDGAHGEHPSLVGDQKFGSAPVSGIGTEDGQFTDARPEPFGPVDRQLAHWEGLHVNGMDVLLNYTARGTKISEQPKSVVAGEQVAFVRTLRLAPPNDRVPNGFSILIADGEGSSGSLTGNIATLSAPNGRVTKVASVGLPVGASLQLKGNRVSVRVPAGTPAGIFKVVLWTGSETDAAQFGSFLPGTPSQTDFAKGGRNRWSEPVVLRGQLNTSTTPDGAYTSDSITSPEKNPWNRRVRFGGFDFFADGRRAAFCTHDGDIWIVSGIDDSLERLEWRRFASGQYETLGLVIVDDVIYTSGRDQITRYYDTNKDGEADYYENFNNDIMSTRGFHEFVFDLQRDDAGNFYFAKANPVNGGGRGFGGGGGNGAVCSHAGGLFKISPDGKKFEVIARGLRAPNGIGVRGDGQVTTSDNEGTWVPTTPINWVDGKTFHGVVNKMTSKELADQFAPPLAWLSHSDYDNSGGGQIWVTSDKWGPFKGEMLHESYGKSSLYLVMKQGISNNRYQGGVVKIPVKFTSSAMRARFNKRDGQLYVAGLSEWQSNAARITGFDRVRYTGKPVYSVRGLQASRTGVQLTFTQPLDKASAEDVQNWSGKRWNYSRSENYGSPEFNVTDPSKKGRENINITSAKLSADGKTVTLTIEDLRPVMQQAIKWDLKAKDGTKLTQEIQHTIHELGQTPALN
jgi:hypothetical protein